MSPFNPLSFLLAFLVAGVALYYLTTMLAYERGPFDVFTKWRLWVYNTFQVPYEKKLNELALNNVNLRNEHSLHWVYDGLTCPVCLSLWFGIPLALYLGYVFYLTIPETLAVWFALSGFSRLIVKHE